MTSITHFDGEDDGVHPLLTSSTPNYSNVTMKRAYLMWVRCGQQNEFKNVCKFYHQLELLEDKMLPEDRVASRYNEFDLLTGKPPTSLYLDMHFPRLYMTSNNNSDSLTNTNDLSFEESLLNHETFRQLTIRKNVTAEELLQMSNMARSYCKDHNISNTRLLEQYQNYIKIVKLENTFDCLAQFIKQQCLKDNLTLHLNKPKHFDFLDEEKEKNAVEEKEKNVVEEKEKNVVEKVSDIDLETLLKKVLKITPKNINEDYYESDKFVTSYVKSTTDSHPKMGIVDHSPTLQPKLDFKMFTIKRSDSR